MTLDKLKTSIEQNVTRSPRITFTIENGRGQTYRNGTPTLYGHDRYQRGSVLAGQPRRLWLGTFEDWQQAKSLRESLPANLRRKVTIVDGGTTFIDADVLCDRAGLPRDDDY